jgi:hypothetical protein
MSSKTVVPFGRRKGSACGRKIMGSYGARRGRGTLRQLGNGQYPIEIKDGILPSVGKKELRKQ